MPGQYCLTKTVAGPSTVSCVDNACIGAPTCDCVVQTQCVGLKCEETGPGQFSCSL
jgi:hypothetical protein